MMATVRSMKELEKVLKQKIKKALEQEVAEEVKDTMVNAIEREVYGVYTPKRYVRAKDDPNVGHDGLIDKDHMQVTPIKDGISVRNVRSDVNPITGEVRDVAAVVEYGSPYLYPWEGMRPRPFTEATREELKNSRSHIIALKKGLERQGLKVK